MRNSRYVWASNVCALSGLRLTRASLDIVCGSQCDVDSAIHFGPN